MSTTSTAGQIGVGKKRSYTQYSRLRNRKGKAALHPAARREVAMIAARAVNRAAEDKVHDDPVSIFADQTGSTVDLSDIISGAAYDERNGDRITPTYFGFRYDVRCNSNAAANLYRRMRVIVFQWLQDSNQTFPNAGDLLATTTGIPGIYSFYNMENAANFRILYDARHLVSPAGGNPDSTQMANVSVPGKRMKKIHYNDTSTNGTNKIFLLVVSDTAVTDDRPAINGMARLKYKDV